MRFPDISLSNMIPARNTIWDLMVLCLACRMKSAAVTSSNVSQYIIAVSSALL